VLLPSALAVTTVSNRRTAMVARFKRNKFIENAVVAKGAAMRIENSSIKWI
jgi:hypothetical protein